MTDHLCKEKRSWNMARIQSKNTKPEIRVRSTFHRLGYRFCLHYTKLPGKPDLVFPKYKLAVFVHGCFWHRHKNCSRASNPKTNQQYWESKFKRNVQRFRQVSSQIRKEGWNVSVIWECQTKDTDKLKHKIKNIRYLHLYKHSYRAVPALNKRDSSAASA